jgi:hypothetical protein
MDYRDKASAKFLADLKIAGSFQEYGATQKAVNPNFYQSGINQLPDLAKIQNKAAK